MKKHIYQFHRYTDWPDELNAAAEDFQSRFGVFPHIMLACNETFLKIDMVASEEEMQGNQKALNENGEPPPNGEFLTLSSFVGAGYEIEFCLEESMPPKSFTLVYDPDPDGGDEEEIQDEKDSIESANAKVA